MLPIDSVEGTHPKTRQLPSPAGLRSVLAWSIFPQPCPYSTIVVDEEVIYPHSQALPSIEFSELSRLEAKYIAYVHIKNPTLDLTTLHEMIAQVAEYGFDWSMRSCVVSLVCALGALSEKYILDPKPLVGEWSEKDTVVAYQYWSVAAKRLGLITGQSSLEAVQCLCLTG